MITSNNNTYQSLSIPVEDKALLFQAALDQSYNSVVITDANCEVGPRIVYANPSFEKMTGYSITELVGQSPKILQGPLTDHKVIEEMRLCIRSGEYFEGSTINYDKNKNPYNVEWSISPIKDQDGVVQYFVSVQKNITAFIKAQQERNLLVRALNDSPDCVMITDIDNKIVFVNTGFEQLTGYKEDEVLGCKPSILWKNLAGTPAEKSEPRNLQQTLHFQTQAPNLHKDGSVFYVDQSIAHIQNETGNITHYVSFSKDSTERLKRELTLKDLASKDALTDLLNRRSGEQLLKQYDDEILSKKSLCLIMLDIDNFKNINDTYGHAGGDEILKSSSQLLKSKARSTDSVVRWGGEEFLILVPDANLNAAVEFAERIRNSIAQHQHQALGFITASFGVAELQAGESTASLLNRADKALYKAKLNGKNCVMSAK
jgi:diguanylate cyclase (GGDEF)-like protein/PAS domain S-box-containing protein